jgi:hypothetical protein
MPGCQWEPWPGECLAPKCFTIHHVAKHKIAYLTNISFVLNGVMALKFLMKNMTNCWNCAAKFAYIWPLNTLWCGFNIKSLLRMILWSLCKAAAQNKFYLSIFTGFEEVGLGLMQVKWESSGGCPFSILVQHSSCDVATAQGSFERREKLSHWGKCGAKYAEKGRHAKQMKDLVATLALDKLGQRERAEHKF